jgi:hypothetical protein
MITKLGHQMPDRIPTQIGPCRIERRGRTLVITCPTESLL